MNRLYYFFACLFLVTCIHSAAAQVNGKVNAVTGGGVVRGEVQSDAYNRIIYPRDPEGAAVLRITDLEQKRAARARAQRRSSSLRNETLITKNDQADDQAGNAPDRAEAEETTSTAAPKAGKKAWWKFWN